MQALSPLGAVGRCCPSCRRRVPWCCGGSQRDAGSSAATAPATHCGSATATLGLVNESVFYFANKYHLFCHAWPPRTGRSSAGCRACPPCISLGVCHVCAASPRPLLGLSPLRGGGRAAGGAGKGWNVLAGPLFTCAAPNRTAGPLLGCGKGGPVPTPAPRGAVMWAAHLGPAAGGFLPCPADLPFSQGRGASKP